MAEQIPRDFIDLLLNRVEIVDLIDARVSLRKKSGSNYFACCPFHQEKNPSFSVSQTKQFFYCFGCGAHGNAIDFLIQFDHLNFPEAIEALAAQVGMEVPKQAYSRSTEKAASQKNLYEILEQVAKFYQGQLRQHPDAERAKNYLKQRGVSGEIAKSFGLGFAPSAWDTVYKHFSSHPEALFETGMLIKKDEGGFYDRFRDRIMFPILDKRGRMIGFGGRIIDKGEPKYLNSPETPIYQKGHELYGLYQALEANRQLQRVLVVEGYMDVIALFQSGITYAVATLGTATSKFHIERLLKHTSGIVFCFDGDQAGRTAAWRALLVTLPLMRDGIQVRFLFLPDGEDPDTLVRKVGQENFLGLLQKSSTITDFFFQTLANQADLSSTDGRARYVKLAKDLLNQMPESLFQNMMLNELAKRARVSIEQIQPRTQKTFSTQKRSLKAQKQPSALRLVMTLLVQVPALVEEIKNPLPHLDIPGFDLLLEIVEIARANPSMTTGQLLENWRDKEAYATLVKLANHEHAIPEQGLIPEFLGSIKKLHQTSLDQNIESLLAKAAQGMITQEEKQILSVLINQKSGASN